MQVGPGNFASRCSESNLESDSAAWPSPCILRDRPNLLCPVRTRTGLHELFGIGQKAFGVGPSIHSVHRHARFSQRDSLLAKEHSLPLGQEAYTFGHSASDGHKNIR